MRDARCDMRNATCEMRDAIVYRIPDAGCRPKRRWGANVVYRISHLASSLSTGCIYRFAFHIMYSFVLYYPYDNNNNNDFFGLEIMKRVDGKGWMEKGG